MLKSLVVLGSLVLSACAVGVRYQSPTDAQDSAQFHGARKSTIYTFDQDGCVATYSYTGEKILIHANQEAFINYHEKIGSNYFCNIWLSFMPEKNATYELRTDLVMDEKARRIILPNFANSQCLVHIAKTNPDGTFIPIAIRQHESKTLTAACNKK